VSFLAVTLGGTSAAGERASQRRSDEPVPPKPEEISVDAAAPVPELTWLLAELRYVTRRMLSDDEKSEETNDWKFAAMVIDRLCFWIFSLYLIIATIAIFTAGGTETYAGRVRELLINVAIFTAPKLALGI